MSQLPPLATLFAGRPWQWGLRGDPHLWSEMEAAFASIPCPATAEGVVSAVELAFAEMTGRPMAHPEPFYVARYDHGGMSAGHVDPRWWRAKGLPLLLEQHAALLRGEAPSAQAPPWKPPAT